MSPRPTGSRGAWTHDKAATLLSSFGHTPLAPYPGMGELWLCQCGTCGTQVEMRLGNVRKGNGQRGCRHCAPNARVAPEHAASVMRAAGYTTQGPYPGAANPWECLCRCGASAAIRYNDVRRGQRGCTRCAGPERGDPDAAAAEMLSAGFTPKLPYPGVDAPWPSVCASCGREPSPSLSGVREGKRCMYCSQKNPSTPEEALGVMRDGGFEPLTPYSGRSKEPWPSRCLKCGRTSTPSLATTRKGHGCRFCAPYGIDPNAPAIVYVLRHPTLEAVKIGIAGTGIAYDRVADHQKHGWDPPAYVHPCETGERAAEIEREVKRSLRPRFGECGYLTRTQMPQGGWTETYPVAELSLEQLRELVDAAANSVS